jgi:hypothetical protein
MKRFSLKQNAGRNILLIKRLETDWRREAKMNSEIGRFEIR